MSKSHLIVFDCQVGPLGSEQEGFGLLVVFLFKTQLGVSHQNLRDALWIVALGHALRVDPIFVVRVPGKLQEVADFFLIAFICQM